MIKLQRKLPAPLRPLQHLGSSKEYKNMGVLPNYPERRPIHVEETNTYYELTESDVESIASTVVVQPASRSQRRKECRESRRLRRFHDALETINPKRNMGARKCRRIESARLLLAMVDKDDIVDDFSDILEQTTTSFAELLKDNAKMAIWNEFIAKDEAEQAAVLADARTITRKKQAQPGSWFIVGGRTPKKEKEPGEKEVAANLAGGDAPDKRQHHPAYSASSCFARMDTRLRKFLGEKNLPWALIDRVNRELHAFFSRDPDGTWRRPLESSRDRLALHSVAQFLMLHSITRRELVDDGTGARISVVEVTNPRAFFIPPHSLLIPYLATKRKTPIEFVPNHRWGDDPVDLNGASLRSDESPETTVIDEGTTEEDTDSPLDSSLEIIEEGEETEE